MSQSQDKLGDPAAMGDVGRQAGWLRLWGDDTQARERLAVPWTARQTLLGAGLTLVPLVVLVARSTLGARQPAPSAPLPPGVDRATAVLTFVVTAVIEAGFLIAPLYHAIAARPRTTTRRDGLRALGLRGFASGRAAVLVLFAWVVIYGCGLLYDQLHIQTNADALRLLALHAPYTALASLLVAMVVAPVCEEIFFRGYLLPGLARVMPPWTAVVTTALVFALAHVDPGSFVPLVVIGLALGVLRWRTGSLWPGIALHVLNNTVAAVYIISVIHLK
jgi:membrane protease YdiL (CAAX protease family)